MKKILILGAMLALSGCYKTTLVNFPDAGSPGTQASVWQHNLILGLVPLTKVDVSQTCGDKGVYSVTTQQGFVQLVLTSLTGGIYTPTVANITCKG
ncbi:MAG: hypothetical protein ACI8RZ_007967 [Myxococcota bacterium]|jgi:hypothetical protein